MKGASNVIWIIVVTLIALVVLVVMVAPIMQAGDTSKNQLSQTDLMNCCDNCWAANPGTGETTNDVNCPMGDATPIPLDTLCQKVIGDNCDNCADIPFCSR